MIGLSGSTRKRSFDGLLAEAAAFFAALDFKQGPRLLIPGTDLDAPSPEQLEEARGLGRRLASEEKTGPEGVRETDS